MSSALSASSRSPLYVQEAEQAAATATSRARSRSDSALSRLAGTYTVLSSASFFDVLTYHVQTGSSSRASCPLSMASRDWSLER